MLAKLPRKTDKRQLLSRHRLLSHNPNTLVHFARSSTIMTCHTHHPTMNFDQKNYYCLDQCHIMFRESIHHKCLSLCDRTQTHHYIPLIRIEIFRLVFFSFRNFPCKQNIKQRTRPNIKMVHAGLLLIKPDLYVRKNE